MEVAAIKAVCQYLGESYYIAKRDTVESICRTILAARGSLPG